jgi:hypothetical protein
MHSRLYTYLEESEAVNPDEIYGIDDVSAAALTALVQRIEASRTPEQMIYRESETDELWRLLSETNAADPAESERLAVLRKAVMEAHELLAVEDMAGAAARLRQVIS